MENIKTKSTVTIYNLKKVLIHFFISFMVSRVYLLDCISPFAMAYLSSFIQSRRKNAVISVLTVMCFIAGSVSTAYKGTALKYLLSYVLFGLIYISFCTLSNKKSKYMLPSISAISITLSGIIYYAQTDNPYYNIAMVLVECLLCFVLSVVFRDISSITYPMGEEIGFNIDDIPSVLILTALVCTGFCGIYLGSISVVKIVSGVIIMIIAFSRGCAFSTTCGVGIGVLYSLYAFEMNEYAGVFGFCGICTGLMKRYRRAGIIFGFVLSSKLMSIYFGGWTDSIFSDFEMIIAVCVFCLIPYSVLVRIKNALEISEYKNAELKFAMEVVKNKLKCVSDAMNRLSSASKHVLGVYPVNTADMTFLCEKAGDKVCKNCGLGFVCWDKEAFDTRDSMNKMIGTINKNGYVGKNDIPDSFKQKCIRYDTFVNELNKAYYKFKSNAGTKCEVNEQRIISRQYEEMSRLVKNTSREIEDCVFFDKKSEGEIYKRLEDNNILCLNATVAKTFDNKASVSLSVRQKNIDKKDICNKISEIVSDITGKNMGIFHCVQKKSRFEIRLCEQNRFDVEFSYRCIPKKGEELCGDSITSGIISDNKYAVVLSDGMGCGEKAARLSEASVELMKQFLSAGFDCTSSVGMVGSAIMMNNCESFATIDAVELDLYDGNVRFIKAGANISYVKRKNAVYKIVSDTLPVGIIDNTRVDVKGFKAEVGDMIILLSDGVHNAADDWFESYIKNINENEPDIICKLLIDEAIKNKKQEDDMTVAVMKIKKMQEVNYD